MTNPIEKHHADRLCSLMETVSDIIGLHLVFHDRLKQSQLPRFWRKHSTPACSEMKAKDEKLCMRHCLGQVHKDLANQSTGSLSRCIYGYTEIVVPVYMQGLFVGVLFAGPFWTEDSPPPHESLFCPPDEKWIENRRLFLEIFAQEIGRILSHKNQKANLDRRQMILGFIQENISKSIVLDDLARTLHLSKSRTSHLVNELFHMTFKQLVYKIKMHQAAHLLVAGDRSIFDIAWDVGFEDQNYFSRTFRNFFSQSPTAYRKKFSHQEA